MYWVIDVQIWKNLGKNIGISLFILIVGTFLISLFSFLNILSNNSLVIAKFIIIFLGFFIGAFKQGKNGNKKGFLEGLTVGGILVFILFIFNYGFYQTLKFKNFIYYFLLLFISMVGGIIGVSKRKEKK